MQSPCLTGRYVVCTGMCPSFPLSPEILIFFTILLVVLLMLTVTLMGSPW